MANYYEPPRRGLGAGGKQLELALNRAPFRIQRVWRAMRDGASLTEALRPSAGAPGESLLSRALRVKEAKRKLSRRGYDRGRAPKARDANKSREPKALALLRLLGAAGVDALALDSEGAGFELRALSGSGSLAGPQSRLVEGALAWWRDQGGRPSRAGPGVSNLVEVVVSLGAKALDVLEKVWPVECSREICDEALGRAGELTIARSDFFKERARLSPSSLAISQALPLSPLNWAGRVILQERPSAIRADRSLSSAMERRARYYLTEIRALEDRAIAEKEAQEISDGLAAAPLSKPRSL